MRSLLILSLILLCQVTWAQTEDTNKTITGTIRNKLRELTSTKPDTLKLSTSALTDSLKHKVPTDSVASKQSSLDSLAQIKLASIDSLVAVNPTTGIESKLDSIENKADSLVESANKLLAEPQRQVDQQLNKISDAVNKPIEDANSKLESISTELEQKANAKLQSAQDRLNELEQTTTEKVNAVSGKLEGLSGQNTPLPNVASPDLAIPDTNLDIPEVNVPEVNVPDVDLPGINGLSNDVSLSGTTIEKPIIELPEVKTNVANLEIPKLEKEIVIPDATKQLSELDGKLAQVEAVEKDLQKVKEGDTEDLEKRVEEQVSQLEPLKETTKEISKATAEQAKYATMVQKYRDQKLLQEEIKRKAQNVVNNKLNQHSKAFMDAQTDLTKIKRKYEDVKSLNDLPKRRTNPMKGKPFKERFLPGVTFQFYHNESFSTDISLHAGWRFSGRLTGYVAGVYRLGVSDSYEYLVKGLNIYGARTYVDWTFKKGFYLHGELEALKANGVTLSQGNGQGTVILDEHLISAIGGVGRTFNISRRVQGSILALYRVELDGYIPEYSKLNVRIGFNYLLWRKKRSELVKMPSVGVK